MSFQMAIKYLLNLPIYGHKLYSHIKPFIVWTAHDVEFYILLKQNHSDDIWLQMSIFKRAVIQLVVNCIS